MTDLGGLTAIHLSLICMTAIKQAKWQAFEKNKKHNFGCLPCLLRCINFYLALCFSDLIPVRSEDKLGAGLPSATHSLDR